MFKSQKLLKIAGLNFNSLGVPIIPAKAGVVKYMPAPRETAVASTGEKNLIFTELEIQLVHNQHKFDCFPLALVAADMSRICTDLCSKWHLLCCLNSGEPCHGFAAELSSTLEAV